MKINGYAEQLPAWLISAVLKGEAFPYPGQSVIPPVVIPAPPQINPRDSDEEKACFIAHAYRSAFYARTGKRSFAMTRGTISKSRYYKTLVIAAELMNEYGISPLPWAYWSMGIWSEWRGVGKAAPVHWIFGSNRIEQRVKQYWRESGDGPARVVLTPMHKTILSIYQQFLLDAKTVGAVKATTKHFPGSTYETLIRKARSEQKSKQRELDARVRNGAWVW